MLRLVFIACGVAAGAFALERLGRARTRAELDGFGPLEAYAIASELTHAQAIKAGLRVLAGDTAIAPAATVEVS